MRKKAPSPRRNAQAPSKRISKTAPSRIIAKRKSSKLKDVAIESLRVATPSESRLQWLRRSGLIAPEEIHANEERVPLDFTELNSRELGAVHSRFAVRHSHGLFELGKLGGEIAMLERDLKLEEARFRAIYKDDYSTKWELDDAMSFNEDIDEMRKRLQIAESKQDIVEAIVKGYEGLTRAASREIARRASEQAPRD
jgi:hypothetical protein